MQARNWFGRTCSVAAVLVLTAIALSCGGSTDGITPPPPPPPPPPPATIGITVLSGGAGADTVMATLAQPLMVVVHDSAGKPLANTQIRFFSFSATDAGGADQYTTLVAPDASSPFVVMSTQQTDSAGRASAVVRLGPIAGTVRFGIRVPAMGAADTLNFVVRPGTAAGVVFAPRDTGVAVGGTTLPRATTVDRYGNVRPDAITYDVPAASSAIATAGRGGIHGVSVGRTQVFARFGTMADSGYVEVVPDATIAAVRSGVGIPGDVVTLKLDGSQVHSVATPANVAPDVVSPVWGPGGSLIYPGDAPQAGGGVALYSIVPGSSPTVLNGSGTPGAADELWPDYNAATNTLYYSAYTPAARRWRLWARSADGTLTEVHAEPDSASESRSSTSPDGRQTAYGASSNGGAVLRVLDWTTGAPSSWATGGVAPAWSPRGNQIAFYSPYGTAIRIMDLDPATGRTPDGAFRTLILGSFEQGAIAWSPDGAWILARVIGGRFDLVSVADGRAIQLGYLSALRNPAWK